MSKYLPHGTTFTIGSQAVGGLISIQTPSRKKGVAESTDTNAGGDRTYLPGLREGGEVVLTFRHDPDDAGQKHLADNFNLNGHYVHETCVISLPPGALAASSAETYSFDGFVISPPQGTLGLVDDKAAEFSCTIKVSGAVTAAPSND